METGRRPRVSDRRLPAGKIYEVVYRAQDPPVAGAGLAAVRDAIAYLNFAPPLDGDPLSIPAGRFSANRVRCVSERALPADLPLLRVQRRRAASQGVRWRDGACCRRRPRELQPALLAALADGHPFLNKFYPTDIFPFTDTAQTDPETGEKDGLLSRVKPEHAPKIFYTNSSYEYWGRAASLIHMTIDGRTDVAPPDHTRIYMFAGGQHGPAAFPPRRSIGQLPNNPNDYRWSMRALLVA